MAFRAAPRIVSRRLSTLAGTIDKSATKGPKLPAGNDPSAAHGPAHAIADTNRWRIVSVVFAVPVLGYAILQSMNEHQHVDAPPEYPYLKIASRVPRFPWGDDDLIGTSYERHAKAHGGEEH
ncbi:hypothetical protein BWQ96_08740 [Gracilariopsis chorda]|uniref:Cytochrome c oxidase subunit 6a, mitochondrial n=1 Tax=Gracilariopsis chorda TaxID=448386 RepID=A0A2V3IHI6_9FLOR|nr:hypothetical protein BWQ96_08740 [Gracilariopsis chorda]|eukprot:PXF41537.1 hypothetical protein BWQ96_08740 [Gracilariopsis chorda]